MRDSDSAAVRHFQEYLRIETVQPQPKYGDAIEFLIKLGRELDLTANVIEVVVRNKPILILTQSGRDAKLPSVLLNSHMDVVPVTHAKWTHPPFEAAIADDTIYARGAQDMKSIGISYLEALRRLKREGHTFSRTVHVSFVPDEEIGGIEGMGAFVATEQFRSLNVGFALDEGIPSPMPSYLIFHGERAVCWVRIKATGNAGHGSALLQGTAVERLERVLSSIQAFRAEQIQRLARSEFAARDSGKFTSINITMLEAGKQMNVIPDEATAGVDIRVAKDQGEEGIRRLLDEWTSAEGVSWEFVQRSPLLEDTRTDDDDPWWMLVKAVFEARDLEYDLATFPGATDSRYLRELGIPALGISPYRNTPIRLHDHDECLGVDEFLSGIAIHQDIIRALTV